jgi:hypothetical protein
MRDRLGAASKLLIWEGDGHAAFASNRCATEATAAFLTDPTSKVPSRCKANDLATVQKILDALPLAKGDKQVDIGAGIALLAVDPTTAAVRTIASAKPKATIDGIAGTLGADGWSKRPGGSSSLPTTLWSKGAITAIALEIPKAVLGQVPELAALDDSVPANGELIVLVVT